MPKLNLSKLTSTGGLEESKTKEVSTSAIPTSAIPAPPGQSSAIPQIGGSAIPAIP